MAARQSVVTPSPDRGLSGLRLFLLASAVYLLCMTPFFVAYAPHLTTSLIGPPGDNMNDFWDTWYSQRAWETSGSHFFFTRLIRFPEGVWLYYQSFAYSDLAAIFLIRKLFHLSAEIPVLLGLHNGILLSSFYLSALGAFYLARRFTRSVVSALLAGFIFAFSPWHVGQFLGHMNVTTIQFIPFFLIFFFRAMESGKALDVAGSILFYCLTAVSSWYYFFYISYFVAFYYLYQVVVQRKLLLRRPLAVMLANFAGALLLLSPLLVPMIRLGWNNPDAYAGGVDDYVADALGYFVVGPHHLLARLGEPLFSRFTGNTVEGTVYLGLINLGLFAWAFFERRRRPIREMAFLLSGILLFAMFASGPHLHILGRPVLPTPVLLLGYLPFFSNVVTPSRAIVFVYVLLAIGAALGLDAALQACRERGRSPVLWVAPILLLAMLDFCPVGLPRIQVNPPRSYAFLAEDPDTSFGVLDLPRGYLQGNAYLFYQTFHHRPIVTATLSRTIALTLMNTLETKDLAAQKQQLIAAHVKYIFIHTDPFSLRNPGEPVDVAAYLRTYRVVSADKNCVVLRVY